MNVPPPPAPKFGEAAYGLGGLWLCWWTVKSWRDVGIWAFLLTAA